MIILKKIARTFISVFVFLPIAVLADTATPPDRGLSNQPGVDITIQSLFGIITGLACWATRFVMVIMVIMIVWYGFRMMASQGNDIKFKDARKSVNYAVIGILVVMLTYTIIATVGNAVDSIGSGDLGGKSAEYTMFVPLDCGGY